MNREQSRDAACLDIPQREAGLRIMYPEMIHSKSVSALTTHFVLQSEAFPQFLQPPLPTFLLAPLNIDRRNTRNNLYPSDPSLLYREPNKFQIFIKTNCGLQSRLCRLLCRLAGDDIRDRRIGGRREDEREGLSSAVLVVLLPNQITLPPPWHELHPRTRPRVL